MAKRGYKLQEFVAHTADVNCVKIGKKGGRLIVTGGDDNKVNLWSIGRPNPLVSLSGHSTPVESVAFHSSEVLIVAGASTGVIKLWDVEQTKMVGTLTGHRSYCNAVEFHPYGEFLASGSMDSNLKIWDIRKKGCIHTYKGHTRGISNIRFSPDGRWVVSGGLDNVVKVWDLTAGKLLHDFKFHEGHIRSIDFHPLEFLLATGSADRTVKFWDLETFELIGSTRPEATGVRAVTFHPDGKTLFCGLDDKLKVFSWEPVICHDAVDMGWSTLGDLCTHEGKLLGCSHYQNSVGVWVADISLIDQYELGLAPEESVTGVQNFDMLGSRSLESKGDGIRSTMGMHSMFSECEEIKNIYVDCSGENNGPREKVGSLNSPKDIFSLESKEVSHFPTPKHVPAKVMHMKTNEQALDNPSMVPSIVPQECPDVEDLSNHKTNSGMLVKPTHVQWASLNKYDVDRLVVAIESESLTNPVSVKEIAMHPNFHTILKVNDEDKESCDEKYSNIKRVAEKFDKVLSPQTPSNQGKANEESTKSSNEISSVKVVSGVAVIQGRIRSLVERFERRENCCATEDQATGVSVTVTPEIDKPQTEKTPSMPLDDKQRRETLICEILEPTSANDQRDLQISRMEPTSANDERELQISEVEPNCANDQREPQITEKEPTCANDQREPQISRRGPSFANDRRREGQTSIREQASAKDQRGRLQISQTGLTPADYQRGRRQFFGRDQSSPNDQRGPLVFGREPTSANNQRKGIQLFGRESNSVIVNDQREGISGREQASTNAVRKEPRISRRELSSANDQREVRVSRRGLKTTSANNQRGPQNFVRELTSANDHRGPRKFGRESSPVDDQIGELKVSQREPISASDQNLTEDLLQTHDAFLSTLRSRLTKLQVVRHYWERSDIRGAVNGLRKMPDHSVQADVVSALKEKMEIWTLDLFSHLLPILVGLLDSNIERHANVSLEILLKLVAVFGPVISSTVSAPPSVGVDLQAEERLECCKECFAQLQKIQKILPWFMRRGGLLARSSQELNLVLQQL